MDHWWEEGPSSLPTLWINIRAICGWTGFELAPNYVAHIKKQTAVEKVVIIFYYLLVAQTKEFN